MTEQQVVVDGLETHVEVVGEGIPVVLIHGLGLTGALWNRVRDSFGPGYQLVASTCAARARRASSGARSSRSSAGRTTSRPCSEPSSIERPVLVGHSLGASIALKVRARTA